MNALLEAMNWIFRPFESALFLPALLILLAALRNAKGLDGSKRLAAALLFAFAFHAAYDVALQNASAAKWLFRLESPFLAALSALALPAALLRSGPAKAILMTAAALFAALAAGEAFWRYSSEVPAGAFAWLLMSPLTLAFAFVGVMALAGSFLEIGAFRKLVRIAALLLLLFGGFAFRKDYLDYKEAVDRRPSLAAKDIMSITETLPVLRDEDRLSYLPAAPCRFSADGGYVQGCNMELAQRAMQLDYSKISAGDAGESALAAKIAAAALGLAALCFAAGRLFCGWLCPLSTLGDLFDFARRRMGLPHLKPSKTVKLSALVAGVATGGFGLLLARAYANVDSNGRFLGCKLPLYPFCKICPGQQVCPAASASPLAFAPLPGTEWLFGFFRCAIPVMLAFFLICFLSSRRLWCRFCPMGMLGGAFNGGAMADLKKDHLKCNGCGACNEACPMDIHTVQEERRKSSVACYDCLLCLKCVSACPQDGCLSFELANHKICESKFKA